MSTQAIQNPRNKFYADRAPSPSPSPPASTSSSAVPSPQPSPGGGGAPPRTQQQNGTSTSTSTGGPAPVIGCPHWKLRGNMTTLTNKFQNATLQKYIEENHVSCIDCDCVVAKEALWACILCDQASSIRCGRQRSKHAQAHFDKTGHSLCINLSTRLIWCYSCDSEILDYEHPVGPDVVCPQHIRDMVAGNDPTQTEQQEPDNEEAGSPISECPVSQITPVGIESQHHEQNFITHLKQIECMKQEINQYKQQINQYKQEILELHGKLNAFTSDLNYEAAEAVMSLHDQNDGNSTKPTKKRKRQIKRHISHLDYYLEMMPSYYKKAKPAVKFGSDGNFRIEISNITYQDSCIRLVIATDTTSGQVYRFLHASDITASVIRRKNASRTFNDFSSPDEKVWVRVPCFRTHKIGQFVNALTALGVQRLVRETLSSIAPDLSKWLIDTCVPLLNGQQYNNATHLT